MPSSTRSPTAAESHLWVTVLAGGVGSRFWPVSTPRRPKQLLALAGDRPLIQDTLERAYSLVPARKVRIVAGRAIGESIVASVPDLDADSLLSEPAARGTAPALVWAAWVLTQADPEAVMVSLHSDHVIHPLAAFRHAILRAAAVAQEGRLVTLGVVPDRPETGYGYIRPTQPLGDPADPQPFEVGSFVEKPNAETAARYVDEGYLWNTGIFVWKASVFLDEVRALTPEIAELLPLVERGDVAGFFAAAPTAQVDTAVLERSSRVATVRATFAWDDVGSWEALARTREADAAGNVSVGDCRVVEGSRNIVYADEGSIVLYGADDLVVVQAGPVTLVTPRRRSAELKTLIAQLPAHLRDPSA